MRLGGHLLVQFFQAGQLGLQCRLLLRVLIVNLFNTRLEFVQPFPERIQQVAHALDVLLAEAAGLVFKDGVGEVLEFLGQRLACRIAHFAQLLELLIGVGALFFGAGVGRGKVLLRDRQLILQFTRAACRLRMLLFERAQSLLRGRLLGSVPAFGEQGHHQRAECNANQQGQQPGQDFHAISP